MAICDSRFRLVMVDIGFQGSDSDGGMWESSGFKNLIESGMCHVRHSDIYLKVTILPYVSTCRSTQIASSCSASRHSAPRKLPHSLQSKLSL